MAGYVGALAIGLAVGLTAIPLCWLVVFARHRRIAYQGDWARAARRGGWVGLFVAAARRPASGRRVPAADRAVPRRDLHRRRDRAVRRAAEPPATAPPIVERAHRPTRRIHDARPAEPFADVKARAAAAVEAARDEILDLSHRIHANPEPAFEEHQAAGWVADVIARPRLRGRAPGRAASRPPSAAGSRAASGRTGRGSAILAEYDALPGLGHGCGHNTMAASGVGAAIALAGGRATRSRARSCSSGTPAEERGSGKQIMIDDGLFEGLDAALLYHPCDRNHVECAPLASEDVSVVFTGLQSHAASRAVGGPQRARRDDRAVLERRACGASSCRPTAASTGSSRRAARPRTSSRTAPGRGS